MYINLVEFFGKMRNMPETEVLQLQSTKVQEFLAGIFIGWF